jgi:putative protease
MTVHDEHGARVLRDLGCDRVVLARENTLDDIRTIRSAVPELVLESFVHGALCIAYSGQCYMSGMISERSANRGSCAQSCRKDYVLTDAANNAELDRGYLISARDLGAWEHLAEIADAGIHTLKVEGRKKKPEYVATVTHGYRAFLDRLAAGDWHPPTPAEVQPLVQIFSRGFTGGMYGGRAGRDYVTRKQPDNRGAVLGEVVGRDKDELIVSVSQPIQRGDGLGFEHPEGPARGNRGFGVRSVRTIGRQGGKVRQAIQPAEDIPAGWTVVRSAEAALLSRARESFAAVPSTGEPERTRLDITALGAAGEPLTLICRTGGGADAVTVKSTTVLAPATRHGLHAERLRAQLGRLGGTPFTLGDLDVAGLGKDLFVPISVLNDLRRQAVRILSEHLERDRRVRHEDRDRAIAEAIAGVALQNANPGPAEPRLVAEVWRLEDARLAADAGAGEISLDLFLRHPMPPVARVTHLATELADRGVTLRLRTPTIVRPEDRKHVEKWLALGTPLVSGHLGMVAELAAQGRDVVADYAVNVFNQHSAALVFRLSARRIVLSVELTGAEMAQVAAPWGGRGFEVFAYGRPEGMTIEHCVLSAAFDREVATCRDLCVQKHPHVELTDPAGYVFPVATDYACRNRLLHSRPLDGSAYLPELWRAGFRNFRLVFNVPGDPVARVTAAYRTSLDALAEGRSPDPGEVRAVTGREYTRGHFARAV